MFFAADEFSPAAMMARIEGYGVAVMTNGDNGRPVIDEIKARVAAAYGWDSLDKPVLR